jgi:hypothetical protein
VFEVCLGTCRESGECAGGCDAACPQPQGPWKFTVSQVVDLCTFSQYNAEVSGRIERGGGGTSCKVNKWFVEGADSSSSWYKQDYKFEKPILPKTEKNKDSLPIGIGGNTKVSWNCLEPRSQVASTNLLHLDCYYHSSERQCTFLQNEGGHRSGVHI